MRRIIRNTKRLFLAVAIITLFGAVACSGENIPTPSVPITMYPPAIYFVNTNIDEASGTTEGFNVSFYVDTNEFSYTESAHVIYYYDVNPPTKVGEPAYSAPGTYIVKAYTDESVAWKNVPPGNHTFSAQVVNVDDTPFVPPVIAQNTIDVPPAGNQTPELRLVSLQMDLTGPQSAQATPQPPLVKKVWEHRTVAVAMHIGPYEKLGASLEKVMAWLSSHGFEADGPVLERYLDQNPLAVKPGELRTEIWIPCKKK